jgi:HAD superfamily hydrolase (TIGR01459 family)
VTALTVSFPRAAAGLRELSADYDVFLVDLWGVVHDGKRPYDGVRPALVELAAAGRRVVFLTNTSRRSEAVAATLAAMGIGPELYEKVISSGDVTHDALAARDPALFARLPAGRPARTVHVGDPSFVPWLFTLDLDFTEELEGADLVVATGAPRDDAELAGVRDRLAPLAARGVPLVGTNPDRIIPTATGSTLGPGAVAAAYAALGAPVFLYGKPHAPIYAAVRRHLRELGRVLAIGDLLETDVRGARGAGIDAALVTATGGQAEALGPTPTAAAVASTCAEAGVTPDVLLARFAW